MKKLEIIVEPGGDELGASIRSEGNFLITTIGTTPEEITENIKDLLADWIQHEGQQKEEWKNVKVEDIEFIYQYDLSSFFEVFNAIKMSEIARLSNINPSLLRQYVGGFAYVSAAQVKKIQDAVHKLGRQLTEIELV